MIYVLYYKKKYFYIDIFFNRKFCIFIEIKNFKQILI